MTLALVLAVLAMPAIAAPPVPVLLAAEAIDPDGPEYDHVRLTFDCHGEPCRVERRAWGDEFWHIVASGTTKGAASEFNPAAGATTFLDRYNDIQSWATRRPSGHVCYRLRAQSAEGTSSPSDEKCVVLSGNPLRIWHNPPGARCEPDGSVTWQLWCRSEESRPLAVQVRHQLDYTGYPAPAWVTVHQNTTPGCYAEVHNLGGPGDVEQWRFVAPDPLGRGQEQPHAQATVPNCAAGEGIALEPVSQRPMFRLPAAEIDLFWGAVMDATEYCIETHEEGHPYQLALCTRAVSATLRIARTGRPLWVRVYTDTVQGRVVSNEQRVDLRDYSLPAGTLYVTSAATASVVAVHPETLEVLRHVSLPVELADAQGLAVSRDGSTLYVATDQSSRLTILDARTLALISSDYQPEAYNRLVSCETEDDLLGCVALHGSLWSGGVRLLDATTPSTPVVLGERMGEQGPPLFGNPQQLAMQGHRLSLPANGLYYASFFDKRNPARIVAQGNYVQWHAYTGPTDVAHMGRRVVMADDSDRALLVFDAPRWSPADPALVGQLLAPNFRSSTGMDLIGDHAWLTHGHNVDGQPRGAVGLVDVSDPQVPRMVDELVFRTICDASDPPVCTPPVERGIHGGIAWGDRFWAKSNGALCRFRHDATLDAIEEEACLVDSRLAGNGDVAMGFATVVPPPPPRPCGLGFETVPALAAIGLLRRRRDRRA